jgi:murein DD-endopeptidase MepM/ murein hydrolase activator NlpD
MALAHAVPVALIHTPVPEPVMTSEYGMRTHPVTGKRSFHGAIDLRAARDQRVESVFDGVVKAACQRRSKSA